jgi:hypothetical protein
LGRFITTLVLLAVFVPVVAQAKRKAPPKVEPVIYEGVRYASPNDNGRRAYVQAWDTATNKMLWEVTVFRNFIVPFPEEDVQHVYIKKMSIRDGKLILVAEDERAYSIDLKTRAVKRLKQAPPETQANKSLQSTRGGALDSSRSRGLFYFAVPAWLSSSH